MKFLRVEEQEFNHENTTDDADRHVSRWNIYGKPKCEEM